MSPSPFIKTMHPRSEIAPHPEAIAKALAAGWVAQEKVHGHRVQLHIAADPEQEVLAYNRHGAPHRRPLTPSQLAELRRLLAPSEGWTVVEGEWLKKEGEILLFDCIVWAGALLRDKTFPDRYTYLPQVYQSPHIATLPVLKRLPRCLEVLESDHERTEGLIFKSTTVRGFHDGALVRCRRKKLRLNE